ncbi:MAG: IS21 family transposase [Verrucomicrobiae bacterium]|nr:IS21 family transposase [Verrucomicrobiae bacterium]
MANNLKMNNIGAIRTLHEQGWSNRQIAQTLGIDRDTVGRHIRKLAASTDEKANAAIPTAGSAGRKSQCEVHAEFIREGLEKGLSAQRIWQDLVEERQFGGAYESVKRFVQQLRASHPQRFWRMECAPGEEVQVDFGTGHWLRSAKGRPRKSHVLRMVLSYSRKGYTEMVLRQDTESFIRSLENGFRSFGGASLTLVLDNLKAGVLQADWFDPQRNPKLAEFGRHYRVAILPTRPKMPRHKGKVENGVNYAQANALKGRSFETVLSANEHLRHWEASVADLRIHGTTRQQVRERFLAERPHLQILPAGLFPCFAEGQRHVHRDSYVEVEHGYYQVPCEHIGKMLWVRWDARMVWVFDLAMKAVCSHLRVERGRFSKSLGAQGGPCRTLAESQAYYMRQAARLGVHVEAWALAVFENRGIEGLRTIQGVIQLARTHGAQQIDQASQHALAQGQWQYRAIKEALRQKPHLQTTMPFLETHPLIRDMDAYAVTPDLFDNPNPSPRDFSAA